MLDLPSSLENDSPEDRLRIKLEAMGAINLSRDLSYASIGDDDAILLLALGKTLGPSRLEKEFYLSDCKSLVPYGAEEFVSRLYRDGLLIDDPGHAKKGAYFFKGEDVWHYRNKVAYRVVPDRLLGAGIEAQDKFLANRAYTDGPALKRLWLAYASSDCMAYLVNQINCYGIQIPEDDWAGVAGTIETALQVHSVAEIWSVIWRVVRDVDSLSRREFYNDRKAAALIPKKLIRYFEKIKKGETQIKPWDRFHDLPAGSLGQVLYDVFGIDENTPGAHIAKIFAEDKKSKEESEDLLTESLRDTANDVMRSALDCGLVPEMLYFFAKGIRQGESINGALLVAIKEYPQLLPPVAVA